MEGYGFGPDHPLRKFIEGQNERGKLKVGLMALYGAPVLSEDSMPMPKRGYHEITNMENIHRPWARKYDI